MSSTTEPKKEHCGGGSHKHGPPSEEERQKREAEFKQAFVDEYHKQHDDSLISGEQTWSLYRAVKENWHGKMKERRQSHDKQDGSHYRGPSPTHFEEKRKQMLSELQKDFQNDFTATHGADKVNADQAWSLIQKAQRNKREKWQTDRQKHSHGPKDRRDTHHVASNEN